MAEWSKSDIVDAYPLSRMQSGMYYHYSTRDGEALYHDVFSIHIEARLDDAALRKSIAQVIAEHPVLRTAFEFTRFSEPVQLVYKEGVARYRCIDGSSCENVEGLISSEIANLQAKPFDLQQRSLIRFTLIRRNDDEYQLLVDAHHMILDGWSMASLLTEVFQKYLAMKGMLAAPIERKRCKATFKDFIRNELEEIGNSDSAQFWRDYLVEHEYRPFVFQPEAERKRVSTLKLSLSGYSRSLEQLARAEKVTLRDVLLAAHLRVCAYLESSSVASTTVVANGRLEVTGGDEALGLFLNSVPLRVPMVRQTWRELIRAVRRELNIVDPYRRYPFAEIAKQHGTAISDVSFNFVHFFVYRQIRGVQGFKIVDGEILEKTNFKLSTTFHLTVSGKLELLLAYDESAIGADGAKRIGAYYEEAIRQVLSGADEYCAASKLLSKDERAFIAMLVPPEPDVVDRTTIQQVFERQARGAPDHVAVELGSESLTYIQLNGRANRLAHYLRERGVGPGVIVGVCMERSIEMIVTLLAVLKAGGAYLPLDPKHPVPRLKYMLDDSAASIVLVHGAPEDALAQFGEKVIDVGGGARNAVEQFPSSDLRPVSGQSDENLAYVIYTSGSTGNPKGVMVEHRGVVRLVIEPGFITLDRKSVVLLLSSICFDVAMFEIWGALLNGGKLVLYPGRDLEFSTLNALINGHKINVMWLMARLFDAWAENLPILERHLSVVVGGEVVSPQSVARVNRTLCPKISLINGYGPTENTIFSCCYKIPSEVDERDSIPLGRPVNHTRCYVLSPELEPVPPGVIGQLYVAGAGVARGYIGLEELTKERFIANPFTGDCNDRFYGTGDLVRQLADGNLEYIGRTDNQVKIRGFRVELAETEHHLGSLEGVESCVVRVHERESGQKQLVAFIIVSPAELNRWEDFVGYCDQQLRRKLPGYMVPSAFVHVQQWPLNPNGKIDHGRLPLPADGTLSNEYVAPNAGLESTLVGIWAELLKIESSSLSVVANFFELGGDSILAMNVVSHAAKRGVHFNVNDLFQAKNIRELAKRVKVSDRAMASQEAIAGDVPLVPLQKTLFEDETDLRHFSQILMLTTPADFDRDALKAIVEKLYEKHDALRLKFPLDGQGLATHLPMTAAMVEGAIDVIESRDPSLQWLSTYTAEARSSLRPAQGRLFKAILITSSAAPATGQRLLLVCHQLVADSVSWRIILQDIETLYGQLKAEQPLSLAPKTSSYQQWARYLTQHAQSAALSEEADYWLDGAELCAVDLTETLGCSGQTGHGAGRVRFELTKLLTEQLLNRSNRAYRTKAEELILSALLTAIHRCTGGRRIRLDVEDHGRDQLASALDVSQTVGCFASAYPVSLTLADDDSVAGVICSVKESYRRVCSRGIGYGILRDVAGALQLKAQAVPELAFRYVEDLEDALRPDGPFAIAAEDEQSIEPMPIATHPLAVVGMIVSGRLSLTLSFDTGRYDPAAMQTFMSNMAQSLEEIVQHCVAVRRGSYTASDFPVAQASMEELRGWEKLVAMSSPAEIEDLYPATAMQQGLLFHSQMVKGIYVTQISMHFHDLSIDVFQQAWKAVIQRHGILRTAFVGLESEHVHQLVLDEAEIDWHTEDLRTLSEAEQNRVICAYRKEDKKRGFATSRAPLMRMSLFRLSDSEAVFLWSHHHALLDGWSLSLILGEVTDCYRALAAGKEPHLPTITAYRDYVAWLQRQDTDAAKSYWRDRLRRIEEPTPLPLVEVAGDHGSYGTRVAEEVMTFSRDETRRLVALAQLSGTTLNVVLQAAWSLLLSRYSNRGRVVFGTVVSGRPAELAGVERIAGLLINTIPVVAEVEANATIAEWLRSLHCQQVESDTYNYLPLPEIQQLAPHPQSLFDSLVVFHNYPVDDAIAQRLREAGLGISDLDTAAETNYGIILGASVDTVLSIKVQANVGIIRAHQIRQVLGHLKELLLRIAESPQGKVGDVEMLTEEDIQESIDQLTRREEHACHTLVHQVFEDQAQCRPDSIAAVYEGQQLTYGELNARANHAALRLSARGVGPDVLVGLCVERSLEMLVGMLAILKAGGAYVPLPPEYPQDRLDYMRSDAAINVVVTQRHLVGRLSGVQQTVCLEDVTDNAGGTARSPENPRIEGLSDRNLAYVIYTSGSTGKPKGVMVEHRNVMRLFKSVEEIFAFNERDCWVMAHSFAFDFSVWEIWGALIHGGRLIVAPKEVVRDAGRLSSLLEEHGVTVLNQTPAAFYTLMHEMLTESCRYKLRYVVFGGEVLSFQRLKPWFESNVSGAVRLINMYGITETTVHATVYPITAVDLDNPGSIIGKPLGDMAALICDENLKLQPAGAVGELLIAGGGLARGYLNRTELTDQRFIHVPYAGNERFFRSGDLVKRLPSGDLVYIGRKDSQVKVRGFRIELDEINNRLEGHPLVSAAVSAAFGEAEDRRLIAYIVPTTRPIAGDAIEEIKTWLGTKLPSYMIPSSIMLLDSLPINANGKVDRGALPPPETDDSREFAPPVTESEKKLCDIWRKILERDEVSIDDNFFEIGGHSLLAARVNAQLKRQFRIDLDFDELFSRPTIRNLAGFIDQELQLESVLRIRSAQQPSSKEQSGVVEI